MPGVSSCRAAVSSFNGSRHALSDQQALWPGMKVIWVTANRTLRAARLSNRGRETAEDIGKRLAVNEPAIPTGGAGCRK